MDMVWLPSVTELNVMNGKDWNGHLDDLWTNPSDEAGSTVFEYFKNKAGDELSKALQATRTEFAKNSFAMNYSIPVYNKGTTTINTNIHPTGNSNDYYWTRSAVSYWYNSVRTVIDTGLFNATYTYNSYFGVRPCVILKY